MAIASANHGLVEREHELDRIRAALDGARAGIGRAIAVEGEPGIGKSAVLEAACAAGTARGMAVLRARGTELETEYPFGVVRQCLEPVLRAAAPAERAELLAGAAALAGPVLLDAPGESEPATFGVLHGLFWLVATLAERRPVVLAIDDAQWCDEPSLRFVGHLGRRIAALPLLLVLTARDAGSAARERDILLAELLADPGVETLRPRALGTRAVAEVLRGAAPDAVGEGFADACHAATGGNPFLLTELARTLRDEGVPFTDAAARRVGELTPPQVARAARARLARLEAPAQALARALVVLGDATPLEVAGELAGLDRAAAARAVDALVDAHLLAAGTELRFRHPLLRAAIAASLTLADRETGHRAAVELLRARRAPPERVAIHLLAIPPGGCEADVGTLRDAARRTVERGAPGAAVPLYRRLLDEHRDAGERAATLLELGRAEYVAGFVTAASEHLAEARRTGDDPIVHGRALALLLQVSSASAQIEQLVACVAPTIAAVGDRDRDLALRLQAYAMLFPHAGAPTAAELARLERLPGDTPGEAVVLAHLIFRSVSTGASAAEVAALAERAARRLDALMQDDTTTTAFSGVALGLRWSDRLDAAEHVLDRALAIAGRRGSTLDFANALGHRAEVRLRRGDLRGAEADARVSTEADVERSWRFARGVNPLLRCLVASGRTAEAADVLDAELGSAVLPDSPPLLSLMLTRAHVRAATGDHLGALAEFDEAVRRRQKWGGVTPSWIDDVLVAADSHRALGHAEQAAELLDQALALATSWDTPGALGQVRHAQALHGAEGDRVERLREAVELFERAPTRLLLAGSLVDLGAALRRVGHRRDAREPLRAGHELARSCGAAGLAERAREELAASGLRLRREQLSGVESLTPSEHRIAAMAADGSSNAQIAQALFVTVKTVEMHLGRVYRKLDVAGRGELARALATSAGPAG